MDYLLIFNIITVILFCFAYHYLVKLESCICAQASKDSKPLANIQMLKYAELFLIVVLLLGIIGLNNNIIFSSPAVMIIMGWIIIAVYIIMVIHVYRLHNNMPADCECAIKWPRYVLYYQWIIYTLGLISLIVIGITASYLAYSNNPEGIKFRKAMNLERSISSKRRR